MIDKGEYTKEQLLSILGCKDLSNAKRTLDRQGYSYTTNNKRGNNYRLIINAVPVSAVSFDNFRKCCKEELGITKNLDFSKLAILVCFLEYDANFVNLTLEQMELRIKECGFILSRQTIAEHLETFKKNNILVYGVNEYAYYVPLDKGTKFITKEEWLEYWDSYYNYPSYVFQRVKKDLGGRPYKRQAMYFGNALVPSYYVLVDNAKSIVKEIKTNE